ncbi:MAG: RNA polymerase sigma factor [Actinomycetota bacterium]
MEGRPLDELELVERAKKGDTDAYEVLVRTYQGVAQRTAYVITGDAGDAEDAAQSAFIKAYYALGRFRSDAPFRPWLLKIVANEALNRRRSAGRREGLRLRLEEDRPREDAAPSPEAAVLAGEPRRVLVEALNSLKEDERRVIALRYFLDLSEKEMAAVMGVAKGTVKSRLSRAMKKLRANLEANELARVGAGHE